MRDIQLPKDAPSELLLQKHIEFLANYGTDKNDYVSFQSLKSHSTMSNLCLLKLCYIAGILYDRVYEDVWNVLGHDCFRPCRMQG